MKTMLSLGILLSSLALSVQTYGSQSICFERTIHSSEVEATHGLRPRAFFLKLSTDDNLIYHYALFASKPQMNKPEHSYAQTGLCTYNIHLGNFLCSENSETETTGMFFINAEKINLDKLEFSHDVNINIFSSLSLQNMNRKSKDQKIMSIAPGRNHGNFEVDVTDCSL